MFAEGDRRSVFVLMRMMCGSTESGVGSDRADSDSRGER